MASQRRKEELNHGTYLDVWNENSKSHGFVRETLMNLLKAIKNLGETEEVIIRCSSSGMQ